MESWQGKHFSITDPKDVNTIIYKINKTEKEFLKDSPKYTVERLDFTEEFRGDLKKKTFFVNNPSEDQTEYKDLTYTPNLKRPISIIDPETTEEIKPTLYFDQETNEIKGKCKLKPYKSYFAFEIREENNKFNLVGGSPAITN